MHAQPYDPKVFGAVVGRKRRMVNLAVVSTAFVFELQIDGSISPAQVVRGSADPCICSTYQTRYFVAQMASRAAQVAPAWHRAAN